VSFTYTVHLCTDQASFYDFIQVVFSSLLFREDIDIGSAMIGDLHKKSKRVQMQVAEVQEGLVQLRETQLRLIYSGLGLQEPTSDIAADVPCARLLLGEFLGCRRSPNSCGFVADVQEALSLDSLDSIPLPSQRSLEGLDGISTQDLAMSQLNIGHYSPVRMSPLPPLSPQELLCSMHSDNPCTPTSIHEGHDQGPWLSRTPALTPRIVLNLDNRLAAQTSKDISGSAMEPKDCEGTDTGSEAASEVPQKRPVRAVAVDASLDDVLARTTHKSDGR
jgi:hypothetical protein